MRTEARYQKYRRMARYPLFLAGVMFIVGLLLTLDPQLDTLDDHRVAGRGLTMVAWAVFLIDYFVSLWLAPDRSEYMRTHVIQAIGVLFPPLRILLIFHVTYEVMRHSRKAFGDRVRLYLVYASTLIISLSSLLVMLAERNAPGATIRNYGDALWWAAETISTVGYGDMYPVTITGRIFAVSLMINGFLILSVLTATVAQKFVTSLTGTDPPPDADPQPEPEV
jgi:voltage-gated potassium channel